MYSRRSGRVAPVVPAAGPLLVGLAALVVVAGCTSSGGAASGRVTRATTPAATQASTAPAASQGTWRPIAAPPIPPAGGMAAAWTGRQLVVWGGGPSGTGNWEASDDGAAYDPAADRWEVLPTAPVPGRLGASAVWSGREVLFWGGQTGPAAVAADGAAYDPAAHRWRTLPPAPIGGRSQHQAVWTGQEMVVWGGIRTCCPVDGVTHDPAAAAYDPAGNRWRRLAAVPAPWSGDGGGAATVAAGVVPYVWRAGRLAGYGAAADRWTETPGLPGRPAGPGATVALATGDGNELFAWTGGAGHPLEGLALRPPGPTVRTVAPLDAQTGSALVAAGPHRLFAAAGQSARILEYRIGEDRWSELPLAPVPTRSGAVLAWTGSELLYWGGNGDEGPEMDGAAWRPSGP